MRKEGDYDQAHDRGGDVEQSLGGPSGSVHVRLVLPTRITGSPQISASSGDPDQTNRKSETAKLRPGMQRSAASSADRKVLRVLGPRYPGRLLRAWSPGRSIEGDDDARTSDRLGFWDL